MSRADPGAAVEFGLVADPLGYIHLYGRHVVGSVIVFSPLNPAVCDCGSEFGGFRCSRTSKPFRAWT
jgi:hypothetical protein